MKIEILAVLCIVCMMISVAVTLLRDGRAKKKNEKSNPRKAATAADGTDAPPLDLFGRPRPTLPIVLPQSGTRMRITTPTKAVADMIPRWGALLEKVVDGTASREEIGELYDGVAMVLRGNIERLPIGAGDVRRLFTLDDIAEFYAGYLEFLTKLLEAKN